MGYNTKPKFLEKWSPWYINSSEENWNCNLKASNVNALVDLFATIFLVVLTKHCLKVQGLQLLGFYISCLLHYNLQKKKSHFYNCSNNYGNVYLLSICDMSNKWLDVLWDIFHLCCGYLKYKQMKKIREYLDKVPKVIHLRKWRSWKWSGLSVYVSQPAFQREQEASIYSIWDFLNMFIMIDFNVRPLSW